MKWIVAALVIWAAWMLLRTSPAKPKRVSGEADARAVLGVGGEAGADEIRAAHRRLIAGVHPDKGGSGELTRRINAARDLLLKRL